MAAGVQLSGSRASPQLIGCMALSKFQELLGFRIHICKVGLVPAPTSKGHCEDSEQGKVLSTIPAWSKFSVSVSLLDGMHRALC